MMSKRNTRKSRSRSLIHYSNNQSSGLSTYTYSRKDSYSISRNMNSSYTDRNRSNSTEKKYRYSKKVSKNRNSISFHKKHKHENKSYHKITKNLRFKVQKSRSFSPSCSAKKKDAGHYRYQIGETIQDKYKIMKKLGDGTFGRVFKVRNLENKKVYALKMIRAVSRYVYSAKIEAGIIKKLQNDNPHSKYILKLYETFDHNKNYCIVFEELGHSLADLLDKNEYRGLPINYLQKLFKKILKGLLQIHNNKLTHTDLKPENILLQKNEFKVYKINKYSTNIQKYNKQYHQLYDKYYLPTTSKIKIIDFGGATYDHEKRNQIINTRQYRGPEVILECYPWNKSSDMWSLGCIFMELYSGDVFFQTHQDYEHLAMIEKSCGKIPGAMIEQCTNEYKQYFTKSSKYYKKYDSHFIWPDFEKDKASIKKVKKMPILSDIISPQHKELKSLIKKMMQIIPEDRISPEEALHHKFFKVKYSKGF